VSIVIAIHNGESIIIGADSLTRIRDNSGIETIGQDLEKVKQINQQLAIASTGAMKEDTQQFFRTSIYSFRNITDFDAAFNFLFQQISKTSFKIYSDELYRISLFGYNGNSPTIKSLVVQPGHDAVRDETLTNVYFSGEEEPVALANAMLDRRIIEPSPEQIRRIITSTIEQCIISYPHVIGGPVNTFILKK
jgi:hypothetical protein